MTAKVVAVQPEETLAVVDELMQQHRIRHIPVVSPVGDLVGLISHRDLLRHALIEQAQTPEFIEQAIRERVAARDLMVVDIQCVGPRSDLRAATQQMLEYKLGCLPVLEGRRLVGILTESDFVRLMAEGE